VGRDRFEARRKALLSGRPTSPVDRWRDEVYAASVDAAIGPTGLYRLPAPTGTGKTLAAAGFALQHAARHGKARVIVAVPFITITEQNAKQYRRLLDAEDESGVRVVLEHHSSVDLDGSSPGHRWQRLAAENWDAPFVVTTTVQLFESLFGRKPGRMRRVHRLANAIIVLDEVQALPHGLLPPIVDGLRILSERFRTTVLLASATQPELWALGPLRDVAVRDVIVDPASLYRALRRARYQWWLDPKPTLEQVARLVANYCPVIPRRPWWDDRANDQPHPPLGTPPTRPPCLPRPLAVQLLVWSSTSAPGDGVQSAPWLPGRGAAEPVNPCETSHARNS
jgi:CRISPR-associated endonuclease/helicase Cas3